MHPCPLAVALLWLSAGIGDEGDAVVLIVVLEECEDVVLEYDGGAEEEGPEVDLTLEVGGAEDDVGERDGADDFVAAGFDRGGHGWKRGLELGEELVGEK